MILLVHSFCSLRHLQIIYVCNNSPISFHQMNDTAFLMRLTYCLRIELSIKLPYFRWRKGARSSFIRAESIVMDLRSWTTNCPPPEWWSWQSSTTSLSSSSLRTTSFFFGFCFIHRSVKFDMISRAIGPSTWIINNKLCYTTQQNEVYIKFRKYSVLFNVEDIFQD